MQALPCGWPLLLNSDATHKPNFAPPKSTNNSKQTNPNRNRTLRALTTVAGVRLGRHGPHQRRPHDRQRQAAPVLHCRDGPLGAVLAECVRVFEAEGFDQSLGAGGSGVGGQ